MIVEYKFVTIAFIRTHPKCATIATVVVKTYVVAKVRHFCIYYALLARKVDVLLQKNIIV